MDPSEVAGLFKPGQLVTVHRRDGPTIASEILSLGPSALVLKLSEGGVVAIQWGQITSIAQGATDF